MVVKGSRRQRGRTRYPKFMEPSELRCATQPPPCIVKWSRSGRWNWGQEKRPNGFPSNASFNHK